MKVSLAECADGEHKSGAYLQELGRRGEERQSRTRSVALQRMSVEGLRDRLSTAARAVEHCQSVSLKGSPGAESIPQVQYVRDRQANRGYFRKASALQEGKFKGECVTHEEKFQAGSVRLYDLVAC